LAQIEDAPVPAVTVAVLKPRLRTEDGYRQSLKTFYLHSTSVFSALEVFYENALYKSIFDI